MRNCVDVSRRFEHAADMASIINECIWYYRYEFTLIDVNVKGNEVSMRFLRIKDTK